MQRLSPWDLVPIDEGSKPKNVKDGVPVISSEIVRMYVPRPEEWPSGGDRNFECSRISAELSKVIQLATTEPFVDLKLYGGYASIMEYPIDISIIKNG